MLDEVAAEAARLAQAQAQPAGLDTEVGSMGSMGGRSRIAGRQAVEHGVNGSPVATATRVDGPGQTQKEDRAKHSSTVEMEHEGERDVPKQLLQQMQSLCDTVKDLGARMDGRFAEEDQKRQPENLVQRKDQTA